MESLSTLPEIENKESCAELVLPEKGTEANKQCNMKEEKVGMTLSLPEYPSYGIIGKCGPDWLEIFHSSRNRQCRKSNFRRQKFDFQEVYENINSLPSSSKNFVVTPLPGLWNLWNNFNKRSSSDIYETNSTLPIRFQNPELLRGYGCEGYEHPLFQTTSSAYGKFPPTINDVPREYHGLKNTFTTHLASTGMPKNRSLNIK